MSDQNQPAGTFQFPPEQTVTAQSFKYVDGPGYYSFYCNNVAFGVNQLDIILVLGEMMELSPSGEALIERRARVTMNPAEAKFLRNILDHLLQIYEAHAGPVQELKTSSLTPIPQKS